jgi:cardiolipin synthase
MGARAARRAGITVLLALAAAFVVVVRRVLLITPHRSWPPSEDAVTAAGARAAAEAVAARRRPRPRDAALDFAWSTAATVEPWAEGRQFFPRIFADVEAAESSVHILMFGWREGVVGMQMADLLARKIEQGVEVRVICDSFGSRPYEQAREMFTQLAEAGAQIVVNDVFPPDRDGLYPHEQRLDWLQDELGSAEHRKLYVVDGAVSWIGGAGIEDHFENGGFHDQMTRVTGDVVRQAQAAFLTSFRGHGGPLPADLSRYFPAPDDPGTMPAALVQTMRGGTWSAAQAIAEQIDGARERLDVMNAYLTDRGMIERVLAAARRGVKVRVVVSETSNNAQASAALRHRYPDLIDAGVEVWEYPGAVVHAKVVVADESASFGTVNLDAWSLYRDSEIAMIVRSAEVAERFEEQLFEPDIARSKPGLPASTPEERRQGRLWNRLSYLL